jgi:DNA-binding transcriptional ArsR family regulator
MPNETDAGDQSARTDREASGNQETSDVSADLWEAVGFLTSSTYRETVLEHLDDQPQTPSDLAEDTGIEITHVSRALRQMRERDLVELLVSENRRKGRIYGITDHGERVWTQFDDSLGGNGGVEA